MLQANYQGVIIPYINYVGRKFDEIEEKNELDQKQSTGVEAVDSNITIQFNSTYLEVLDKAYNLRGIINFFSVGISILFIFIFILIIAVIIKDGFELIDVYGAFLLLLVLGLFFILYKIGLKNDLLGYTHYPIRFNRKTKKVYVFKNKNDIRVFDWNKLKVSITMILTDHKKKDHDIRFSQLDENGIVVDAFSLPYLTSTKAIYTEEDGYQFINEIVSMNAASNWEYIRCYMEEDINISYQAVKRLIPLNKKRESLFQSMKASWYYVPKTYSFKEVKNSNLEYAVDIQETYENNLVTIFLKGLFFFLICISFIGRLFVMRIAKKPKWTQNVEDACVVDSNDRYNYERYPNQGHEKAHETSLGIIIKLIAFCLCYVSVYGFLWIFDTIAAVKGSGFPVRFSDYLAFWNWF